jgi:hypothetical protein
MARKAGLEITVDPTETPLRTFVEGWDDQLKAFEALVRADEREACAKTKAGKPRELKPVGRGTLLGEQQFCFDKGWREGAASVRAAIRAIGETK